MAITDIDISETLETGAPSIKYTGNMDPNMQMASASDAQQEEADKLWKLELKKMELDENYIPEIIDPEEIKVASDPSWESEWEDAYQNYKLKQIELGQEFVSKEEFMEDYQNNMASGGRVKFGLGSILKSVGKAAKKVVKSPIGKAALLGMAGWGIPGTSFKGLIGGGGGGLGSFFGKGSFSPFKAMIGQGTADMGLGPSGLGKLLGSNFVNQATGALTGLGWGAGAVGAGMAAQAFENMKPDDIAALKQNPEALRAYLKQYHSNTNPDKTDEEVDLWVEQNMYSTGGRVGFASGANEKFEEKISALLAKGLSRELAEAIVLSDISPDNFQIIDALENKAEGGRIGYKDAGGVRMASASDPMDDKNQLSLRLFGKPLNSLTEDELIDLDEWMEDKAQKWQGAQGGRIGFAERGTIQDMTISDSPNDPRNMTTIEIISIIKEGRSTPEMFAELRLRGIKGVDEIALAEGQGDVGYSFDERLVDEYNPKTGTAEESFLFKMRRNNPEVYGKYEEPQGYPEAGPTIMDKNYPEAGPSAEPTWMKAEGGRIGFAYGPDQTAEAAGIMGQLPVRNNSAGVKELDLRDSGGFIPPVGVKEKADDIPAMLSNNEFVMTADAVRAAGGGSVEKGAQVMYDQMKNLEKRIA